MPHAANDNGALGALRPQRLKLVFSHAADYQRINALFEPATKRQIDPHDYVVKREETFFTVAIRSGSAAILKDENGDVQTLTIAYRVRHPRTPANQNEHDATEMGTSLARLPGYNSAKLVVAALTLREWWQAPPRHAIMAEIKRTNIPSAKTYIDGLHWSPLHDKMRSDFLYEAADTTLVDEADKGAGSPVHPSQAASCWHIVTDATVRQSAKVVLEFMAQGGLHNKHTGDNIPVDFGTLAAIGLTRARLQAIASGTLDRKALYGIGGPKPAP